MHYFQLVVIPLRQFHMDIRFTIAMYSAIYVKFYMENFPLTKDRALDTYTEYFWYKAINLAF